MQVTIDLSQAHTHEVEVTIRGKSIPELLQFPVWTPGSYMVREFPKNVLDMKGASKVNKFTWRVSTQAKQVRYKVYCFDRSVRTSFVDENYATLVGATLLPLLKTKFTVELVLPKGWPLIGSALAFRKKASNRYLCKVKNDDEWIDSPIVAAAKGYGQKTTYRIKSVPHEIVWVGDFCAKPLKEIKEDFQKICEVVVRMFGGAPFKRYTTLLHFYPKSYGGLEHRSSQLSQFDGADLANDKRYKKFLTLFAHEYFHSWNVKAIRPEAYGPFDYFSENHSEDIWFAEGMTDYFDDWIVHQAKLISDKEYKAARLEDVEIMPDGRVGHTRRSLAESSFDAWISLYRRDENFSNADISYYSKGAQLGWLWDALLQKKSKGKWNLAKLMKAIYKEFGVMADELLAEAKPGFTRDELLLFCEEKTGINQRKQLERWITSRKSLPWQDAADFFGFKFTKKTKDIILHKTGLQVSFAKDSATVDVVYLHSAGSVAKLSPKDEILAIDNRRITKKEQFERILEASKGQVNLLICRGEQIIQKPLQLRPHPGLGESFHVK